VAIVNNLDVRHRILFLRFDGAVGEYSAMGSSVGDLGDFASASAAMLAD
jgi:hypothetical protein